MTNPLSSKRPYVWPVGKGGFVSLERIVAIACWDSAPIKRATRIAAIENRLVDLTFGKRITWVLYLDSGHLVLISDAVPVATLDDDNNHDWRLLAHE